MVKLREREESAAEGERRLDEAYRREIVSLTEQHRDEVTQLNAQHQAALSSAHEAQRQREQDSDDRSGLFLPKFCSDKSCAVILTS